MHVVQVTMHRKSVHGGASKIVAPSMHQRTRTLLYLFTSSTVSLNIWYLKFYRPQDHICLKKMATDIQYKVL
jgi:hypothetical protein